MKRTILFLLTYFIVGSIGLMAQTQTSGVVVDESGETLVGASVLSKGDIRIGTITDIDGRFSLEVPENSLIVVSYVGMVAVELKATTNMRIVLSLALKELKELVVTAVGVTREKKALGYAATSIKGDDISKAKTVNPMNALQGRVAGLEVSTAPGPGSTQNVLIRGASSFANNQPLYIVDGTPITNSQNRSGNSLNAQVDFGSGINALNPDDIADMTVLKGAAATALYGSRAANGVIMITTKSGENSAGKVQVVYDGGLTFSRIDRLPQQQNQFGQGWSGTRALDENGNWGAPFDGKDRVWGQIVDGTQQTKPYRFLKNRIRDFYETGIGYKNALSFSGGTAQTTYYTSISQNRVDGVIPTDHDSYSRYTISTRGLHKAGDFTLSSSVNVSSEKTKSVPSGQGRSLNRSLAEVAGDISIVDFKDYKKPFNNLEDYFTPYGVNPYFILNENAAEQNKFKLFGKFQIDYDLLKNLKLTYRLGGDYENSIAETHTAVIAISDKSPNHEVADPGSYAETRQSYSQMNHDFMASYHTQFTDKIAFNAVLGMNINERRSSWLLGAVTSIDIPGNYMLTNSLAPAISSQGKAIRRLVGAYINSDFSYHDYLYLTLTARNDWSSTLPIENNSFFYPGATLGFILTDYLKSMDVNTGALNFLKLRTAYGMTGNDAAPYYIYDRYVSTVLLNPGYPDVDNLTFPLNGVNAFSVSNRLGNNNLKPEITSEFEVGTELRMFDNRIGLDFSYYNKLTKGLIEVLQKDPSSGFTQQVGNLGDIRNKGIELVLNLTPVRIKSFSWNLSWNLTKNQNRVERLDVKEVYLGGFGGAGIYAVEGKAIGQFKTTKTKTTTIDGKEFTIVDGKGNPQATEDTEFLGKDINEKFRMGFVNTFSWKGLVLSATIDYRSGGYIYSNTKDYMHWTGSSPESVLNDRKPFLVPNSVIDNGDGTFSENTIPVDPTALHTFYSNGGFQRDDYAVLERSYVKLRDLSLSYQLPEKICKRLDMKAIRLSFNAGNILMWTPEKNPYIDPETTTFGNDVSAKFGEFSGNPSNRYYTVGLAVSF